MIQGKTIDFLFLVSRPPIMNSGYVIKHAILLAEGVKEKGYSAALLVLPQSEIKISLIRTKRRAMPFGLFFFSFLFSSLFLSSVGNYLFQVLNGKLNKNAFKFKVQSGIKVYFAKTKYLSFSKRVVCNDWGSAYYLLNRIDTKKGYFIVYHSNENDIVTLADVVTSTYSRGFNIIAGNEATRKKFNLDRRCAVTVALDVNKISSRSGDGRKANTILIPLRRNTNKGAEYAIEAIYLILKKRSDVTIFTFGDYKTVPSANSNWVHLGAVTDEVLVDLFKKVEIFVSPSIEDGVPGIALEAMANGCAVISTDVSGARELIEEGVNGMIIPTRDYISIVNSVVFLLTHREVMTKFQSNANAVLDKFSKKNMVETFLSAVNYYESSSDQGQGRSS